MSLPPAPSNQHNSWTDITIHTAKCDICHQNNKSVMQRCRLCNMQFCRRCVSQGKVQSTNHTMDQSKIDSETKAYKEDQGQSEDSAEKPTPRANPKSESSIDSKRKVLPSSAGTPSKMQKTGMDSRQPSGPNIRQPFGEYDEEDNDDEYDEDQIRRAFPYSHRDRSERDQERARPRPRREQPRLYGGEEYAYEEGHSRLDYPVPRTEYFVYPDGEFVQYEIPPPPNSQPSKSTSQDQHSRPRKSQDQYGQSTLPESQRLSSGLAYESRPSRHADLDHLQSPRNPPQARHREDETSRHQLVPAHHQQSRVDELVADLGDIDQETLEDLRGKSIADVVAIITMAKRFTKKDSDP